MVVETKNNTYVGVIAFENDSYILIDVFDDCDYVKVFKKDIIDMYNED